MSHPRIIALVLALLTVVVYLPVTRNDFLSFDDDVYVTDNPAVLRGVDAAGIKWAFTTFRCANWHPLTWLSHMLDCQLFGANPGAHHLVNVLFHAANAVLVFFLLLRLTSLPVPAACVATLFAWHPLHVESVAWVAERKDVLSTFFGLLALLCYVQYARGNSRRDYWPALVFFALGLLAKPMLVTLPFLLFLLDFWPLQRLSFNAFHWALIREKIPFFALTAVSCVMTFIAQSRGGAVMTIAEIPASYRVENALVSLAQYLLKLAWPVNLAVIYPLEYIPRAAVAGAAIMVVCISAAVWFGRNRQRCWLFGWLWFLGTLVPVIGVVQVGSASMADRYTYLPSIGIFTALVFGLYALPRFRRYLPLVIVLPLGAGVWLTERQLSYWRDSETLFRHTLAVTKNNGYAHLNLAIALDRKDEPAHALAEYHEAARISPASDISHLGAGNMLLKLNHPQDALVEFRECIRLNPYQAMFHARAANALAAAGDLSAALPEFAEAERLDPGLSAPHLDLAQIYFQNGDASRAREELKAAAYADPNNPWTLATIAHYLAANADDAARDPAGALALALKANDLSGNREPEVFDVLGMAFAANGDFTNAMICAQNALDFTPAARLKEKDAIRARRELYQRQQPWRESFRAAHSAAAPAID